MTLSVATAYAQIPQGNFQPQPIVQSKLDFTFEQIIAEAQAQGTPLGSVFFRGTMSIQGVHNLESLTQLFQGQEVQIRAIIPTPANTTIATFAASLSTILKLAEVKEVISIQGPQPIGALPAFLGHN